MDRLEELRASLGDRLPEQLRAYAVFFVKVDDRLGPIMELAAEEIERLESEARTCDQDYREQLDKCKEKIEAGRRREEGLREAVRGFEWQPVTNDWGEAFRRCAVCHAIEGRGHTPNCKLAAALAAKGATGDE